MGRKLLLLNLIMLAGIVVLAQHFVAAWKEFEGSVNVVPSMPKRELTVSVPEPPEPIEALAGFLIIPERNLFSPMRGAEPDEDAEEAEEQAPTIAVEPDLLSVMSFGDTREAVLNVYQGRRGREATTTVVRLGDEVQGWEVTEIGDDRVVISWREEQKVLEMGEPTEAPKRQSRSQQAVNIITVGAAGAAVETTSPTEAEEEGRGVEVGVVGSRAGQQTGRGGRLGGAGQRGGLGQQGVGPTGGQPGQLGGSSRGNIGRGGRGATQQRLPGTVGGVTRPTPTRPPLD